MPERPIIYAKRPPRRSPRPVKKKERPAKTTTYLARRIILGLK